MKLASCLFALTSIAAFAQDQWVTYPGGEGPGKGKHIVLLAGDEEYRSEESLPQLAKILSQRHGFTCTVLFSVNKQSGEIDPNTADNEPGMQSLENADLVIMGLRFRKWPAEQAKFFVDYCNAGKPFIGLRTSTHAFQFPGDHPNKDLNQFGKQVLGEQWVSHWGSHKHEATRGAIEPGSESDPILRGVKDVFGNTDVYEAYPPSDAKILLRGVVLKGMNPTDEPADYKKKRANDGKEQGVNDPSMPVAWTREHKNPSGKTNKVLTTTMGSATDLANEGLRRMVVNAAYALTGLEVPTSGTDVTVVGTYEPSMYGFGGGKKGVKPADHAAH